MLTFLLITFLIKSLYIRQYTNLYLNILGVVGYPEEWNCSLVKS